MRLVLLTPGTGSYHCGVCMRDNALAKELIRTGHEAAMLPMYLPLTLDEAAASPETPIFFGGINVYLQQKSALFRHTPRWLDSLLNNRWLLRKVAGSSASQTGGPEIGALTHSMLLGEEGRQAKELEELLCWLRAHKPDAVWLSTALLVGLARQITRDPGVPVLASLQGEDSFLDSLAEPWRTRCWETLAVRGRDVAAFVAPSRYYAELMGGQMRIAGEKMHVIPNGVPVEDFDARQSGDSRSGAIGYLARMTAGKGLGTVVDAFILLKKRGHFPDAKLLVVGSMTSGDSEYVESLKQKLNAAGCASAVEWHPNVSREEKAALLRRFTLLSVPATYGEAFGLYVAEAWAAGVPVVQPRCAAFTELVEVTGAGRLFEPANTNALVEEWEKLLAHPEEAHALGQRGREAVEREYSIARMAERFVAVTRGLAAVRADS
jgi:glycosyltransferase involved in cell wall biosynthesis